MSDPQTDHPAEPTPISLDGESHLPDVLGEVTGDISLEDPLNIDASAEAQSAAPPTEAINSAPPNEEPDLPGKTPDEDAPTEEADDRTEEEDLPAADPRSIDIPDLLPADAADRRTEAEDLLPADPAVDPDHRTEEEDFPDADRRTEEEDFPDGDRRPEEEDSPDDQPPADGYARSADSGARPTFESNGVLFATGAPSGEVLMTRIGNAEDQTYAVSPPPAPPDRSPRRRGRCSLSPVAAQFLAQAPVACTVPATLAAVVSELQDHLDVAMCESRFQDSKRALHAVESARAQLLLSLKLQHQAEVQAELAAKRRAAEAQRSEFAAEMAARERELEDALQRGADTMTARHLETQRQHDIAWATEPRTRHYNRTSQRLRVLRVQQQYLLAAKRFDEAEQVCRIADRQHEEESVENQYQRFVSYADSRARLDLRQANEEDTITRDRGVRRGRLMFERERAARRFTKRFRNLEVEDERAQDRERLWAVYHRNDGDYVATLNRGTRSPATKVEKKAKVNLFNTLPLPPLPAAHSPRGVRPRGSSTTFVVPSLPSV
jgi:hypothetical protein